MDKAIVSKVESILDNTGKVTKMHIGIFADADEIPTIRYSVEELIVPEQEEAVDEDCVSYDCKC